MNSYIWISAASTYQYVPVRTSTSISNLVVGLALFSFCIRHPFVRAILIISGFKRLSAHLLAAFCGAANVPFCCVLRHASYRCRYR